MSELSVGQLKGLTVNNNVMTVPSGHTLYAPGHVIQVQSVYTYSVFTTTSLSLTDVTGISVTITPKSATSKVFVLMNVAFNTISSGSYVVLEVIRDGAVSVAGQSQNYTGGLSWQIPSILSKLDTPNTTSPVTYKLQMRTNGNASLYNGTTLTVMEIAA